VSTKDRVLVYSTDPKDKALIDGSAEKNRKNATLQEIVDSKKFVIVFRLETNSRGGKTVTVLDKLPAHEPFVKELTKELKVKCGTGGSYKLNGDYATIEIQGDKRLAVKKILDEKSIKYKGM
jgi:translation initiation factor 1